MRNLIVLIGLVLGVMGCTTTKPEPVIVKVPTYLPCLSVRPVTPVMQFDLLPKARSEEESAQHVRILWKDRQALLQHSIDWDVAAAGCQIIEVIHEVQVTTYVR